MPQPHGEQIGRDERIAAETIFIATMPPIAESEPADPIGLRPDGRDAIQVISRPDVEAVEER